MDNQSVFKPSAQMTFLTIQADSKRLTDYCSNSRNAAISIDLGEVTKCDSAGLALLIEAKRLSKAQGKACKIIAIPTVIQALAQFCGVEGILMAG